MNHSDCGTVRELLPDVVAGRSDDPGAGRIDAHLSRCAECRAELELIQMLVASRPSAPAQLTARVTHALRTEARPRVRPWWGISAAAVAALALGIGVVSEPTASGDFDLAPELASEIEESEMWLSDDGLLAGAPALDALSDEALLQLLDELSAEGGAA